MNEASALPNPQLSGGSNPAVDPLKAGTSLIHYGATWTREAAESTARGKQNVAVLVCHGMGQQVRYETISAVAQSLGDIAAKKGMAVSPVEVHLSQENDAFLVRTELGWKDKGAQEHCVHVYEAYWAPLTEGRVTYWDTIKFLLSAAGNCCRFMNPWKEFRRWIFGERKKLPITRWPFIFVIVLVVVILLQIAFGAYVAAGLGQAYVKLMSHPLPAATSIWRASEWKRWWTLLEDGSVRKLLESLAVWAALTWAARWVKNVIVEYAGDVAAYISPYKDSKFDELRHRIQKVGLDVGKIIYGFGAPSEAVPQYQHVVVMGHSLGSVLAYDTLNALINQDQTGNVSERRDVLKRTRALITFGSPLDKTAFIFRMQAKNSQDWLREQLAASVQPLIVSYENYRPKTFEWVNIWSPLDIISGSLDYYDDPAVPANDPRHVHNMKDPQAKVPVHAHVEYWGHDLLAEQLYRLVS